MSDTSETSPETQQDSSFEASKEESKKEKASLFGNCLQLFNKRIVAQHLCFDGYTFDEIKEMLEVSEYVLVSLFKDQLRAPKLAQKIKTNSKIPLKSGSSHVANFMKDIRARNIMFSEKLIKYNKLPPRKWE